MSRLLKKISRGAILCVAVALQVAAVPNSIDSPVATAGTAAPVVQFNSSQNCGTCVNDGYDDFGYMWHHMDEYECFPDALDCQACNSHTEGCHTNSLFDPENPEISCNDGILCPYARMAEELEKDIRSALKDGDDAAVARLMIKTELPFAIDTKASTARLYGCYGLLTAEIPVSQRLASELSAESCPSGRNSEIAS